MAYCTGYDGRTRVEPQKSAQCPSVIMFTLRRPDSFNDARGMTLPRRNRSDVTDLVGCNFHDFASGGVRFPTGHQRPWSRASRHFGEQCACATLAACSSAVFMMSFGKIPAILSGPSCRRGQAPFRSPATLGSPCRRRWVRSSPEDVRKGRQWPSASLDQAHGDNPNTGAGDNRARFRHPFMAYANSTYG